jgi:hypothetical protein
MSSCWYCGVAAVGTVAIGFSMAKGTFSEGTTTVPVCNEYPVCVEVDRRVEAIEKFADKLGEPTLTIGLVSATRRGVKDG